ncbi:MAG TPA: nucleoside diphosphate kinase regulator [Pseudobdellovibrionaceae bacterium]|nr:nucleoside diphosphate kinase regulator [Pseudobdellovibrionaceae bacterium]
MNSTHKASAALPIEDRHLQATETNLPAGSGSDSGSGERPDVYIAASAYEELLRLAEAAQAEDLAEELRRAHVIPDAQFPRDAVKLGAQVHYRDEKSGEQRWVTLVRPYEADLAQGRLSILTPVGMALLGLKPGAQIEWQMPRRERRHLRVLEVRQPESEVASQSEGQREGEDA